MGSDQWTSRSRIIPLWLYAVYFCLDILTKRLISQWPNCIVVSWNWGTCEKFLIRKCHFISLWVDKTSLCLLENLLWTGLTITGTLLGAITNMSRERWKFAPEVSKFHLHSFSFQLPFLCFSCILWFLLFSWKLNGCRSSSPSHFWLKFNRKRRKYLSMEGSIQILEFTLIR